MVDGWIEGERVSDSETERQAGEIERERDCKWMWTTVGRIAGWIAALHSECTRVNLDV